MEFDRHALSKGCKQVRFLNQKEVKEFKKLASNLTQHYRKLLAIKLLLWPSRFQGGSHTMQAASSFVW